MLDWIDYGSEGWGVRVPPSAPPPTTPSGLLWACTFPLVSGVLLAVLFLA